MWIMPVAFASNGETFTLSVKDQVPLPPWSGVPVALELELDRATVTRLAEVADEGTLFARDEAGRLVRCVACVDPQGSHTCESDSFLVLVQCGPFEQDGATPA